MMADPYPVYRRLREEQPIFWSDTWNAWVVSRFDDVAASLKDKENLSNENRQGLLFAGLTDDERQSLCPLRHYFAQKDVIGSDPPDHTRMRALVQKELNQIKRDRRIMMSLVLPPIMQLMLFGTVMNPDVANINLGIVDDSHSPESRDLIAALTAMLDDLARAGFRPPLGTKESVLARLVGREWADRLVLAYYRRFDKPAYRVLQHGHW